MNQAGIQNGDLLLIRVQNIANNGDKVVALIDNEVTVKEFRKSDVTCMLVPHSDDPQYQSIVISDDCSIQGVVEKVFPGNLFPK
jgi:repressor LexA